VVLPAVAAVPARSELTLDRLAAAGAAPWRSRARLRPQELPQYRFGVGAVRFTLENQLQGALRKRDLSRKADQILVPDAAAYARGLQQVLQMVNLDEVQRRE
jgi:hypothetical protein